MTMEIVTVMTGADGHGNDSETMTAAKENNYIDIGCNEKCTTKATKMTMSTRSMAKVRVMIMASQYNTIQHHTI